MCDHLICSTCDNLTARKTKTTKILVLLFLKSQYSYHIISLLLQKEKYKAHSHSLLTQHMLRALEGTYSDVTCQRCQQALSHRPPGQGHLVAGFGARVSKAQHRHIFIPTTAGHPVPMVLFENIIVSLVQVSKYSKRKALFSYHGTHKGKGIGSLYCCQFSRLSLTPEAHACRDRSQRQELPPFASKHHPPSPGDVLNLLGTSLTRSLSSLPSNDKTISPIHCFQ